MMPLSELYRKPQGGLIGGYTPSREVVDRATLLPIGQYEDGSLTLAWPGFLKDAWEGGIRSLVAQEGAPVFDDGGQYVSGATAQPLDAFNAASIAPMAGVAAKGAGAIPRGALGLGGSDVLNQAATALEHPARAVKAREHAGGYRLVGGPEETVSPEHTPTELLGLFGAAHIDNLLPEVAAQYRLSRNMGDGPAGSARAAFEYGRDLKRDMRSSWYDAFTESLAGDKQPFHYNIVDGDGGHAGSATGYVRGDTMWFDWFGGGHHNPTPLGVKGLRQLREQIRSDFPGVTNFSGVRVSGSRGGLQGNAARQQVTLAANDANASLPSLLANALDQPKGIRAYHGSPHDFDEFDMSKIGTGEGAQAFGHGLYFGEKPGVAGNYRGPATGDWSQFGKTPEGVASDFLGAYGAHAVRRLSSAQDVPEHLRQPALDLIKAGHSEETLAAMAVKAIESAGHLKRGRMYEVRINAEPEQFVDWDKPLNAQTPAIRDAIRPFWDAEDLQPFLREEEAAELLREAGIPGIRYLDGMSRDAGEGSYNYVVNDASLIEILRKYGLLGTAGLGASMFGSEEAPAGGLLGQ